MTLKKLLVKSARSLGRAFGTKRAEKLVIIIQKTTDVNILKIALNRYGILVNANVNESGESFIMEKLIAPLLDPEECIIDVGANKGDYIDLARKHLPVNPIIAIEPNPKFEDLLKSRQGVEVLINACGNKREMVLLHVPENPAHSSKASLTDFQQNDIIFKPIEVECIRLCDVISERKSESPGLVKIDVEGHDLAVIQGLSPYIAETKFIQFEFNELQVFTRTFLKDYHDLLSPTHDIFRLDKNRLHNLNTYHPLMEIFRMQNILAVRKDLAVSAHKLVKV